MKPSDKLRAVPITPDVLEAAGLTEHPLLGVRLGAYSLADVDEALKVLEQAGRWRLGQ